MNMAETVKINKQIIKLIYKKAEATHSSELSPLDRNYVSHLKGDNAQAKQWLKQGIAK